MDKNGLPNRNNTVSTVLAQTHNTHTKMTTTETLTAIAISISSKIAPHTVVCEFNAEDNTPTLHVDLWRGYSISDLPAQVTELKMVCAGFWDGGYSYSFQV